MPPALLPAAVRRRADEATRLLTESAARLNGAPQPAAVPQPIPSSPAAGADLATLQRQLADTQENLRKANERHDTLQAKYNAEVPRAAADLRTAKTDLLKAQARTQELEQAMQRRIETGDVNSLTDEEKKLLGPAMMLSIAKIAGEVVTRVVDSDLSKRLQPMNDRIDLFERMSEAAYWAVLEDGVPDWERVNDEPKFTAWLNQVDPTTQRTRMDLLKRAEAARQGNRIVEIFRAYKEQREIGALSAPANPAPNPLEQRGIDPPPGGSAQPELDAQGRRIWKRTEIKAFYSDKAKGKYRGKEAEARDLELDIFAANKEHRVRED